MTATHAVDGFKRGKGLGRLFLLLMLTLSLQTGNGRSIQGAGSKTACLEGAAVVAWAVVVEALADDFSAAHNNAAVAKVHGREGGLLEAEIEIMVRLHFESVR